MSKTGLYIIISAVLIVGILLVVHIFTTKDDGDNGANYSEVNNKIETVEKENEGNPVVVFETSLGDISLELFKDKMPVTVGNFEKLVSEGFYDETKFHRVINNFMIQGGDPNSKGDNTAEYGRGGPGYTIEDEFGEGLSNIRGTIAMANTGQPNSGGSQFFINHIDNTGLDFDKPPLTSKHPVFGYVVEGMDVVDEIANVAVSGQGNVPVEPVVIKRVYIK